MRALEAKILDATHLELIEPLTLRPGRMVEVSIRPDDGEEVMGGSNEETSVSVTERGAAPGLSGPRRHRELEWRRSHRDQLRAYAGQWVVLEGEEIVAHGNTMARPVEQARSQGIRIPYVFYVEESRQCRTTASPGCTSPTSITA